jgi:FSR family fosmidomycin resistance protein-like MFS transporter
MDAAPARQEQLMARWTLAGAIGAVAGPGLLAVVIAAGGSWRTAFLVLALVAGVAWLALVSAGARLAARPVPEPGPAGDAGNPRPDHDLGISEIGVSGSDGAADTELPWTARFRRAGQALRDRSVLRWLLLLEISDLLLDAFTGFVAVYLVAVAGVSPAQAALAVGVRLAAALLLYPAFLLAPGFWPKVVILAGLSLVTAAWYPVLQAQLYASLPGQSGTVVSLLSAAGLAGGLGPLTVGFVAGALGLGWALSLLTVVPAAMLALPGAPFRRRA